MQSLNRILRTADPLDANVSDIDTSFPKIPAQMYELNIKSAEAVDNNAGTGRNLKIELVTTSECQSISGDVVAPGFPIFHNISLTETAKYPATSIAKAVATLAQAAGISGVSARGIIDNPTQLVGKVVTANVGLSKETNEFPSRNNIKQFIVKK